MTQQENNPLGTLPIPKLIRKFAVPSIIAMLVGALYNIVDQLFIGQSVGQLGNAATNVTFPLSIACIALALLFGIGGAASFNLTMGRGNKREAAFYVGNALSMLFICGLVLAVIAELFLDPMLKFFGTPDVVFGYAKTYTRITAIGFPALILSTGGGHLIRADGSPKYMMICNLSGAVINTVLDYVFIFIFNKGMAGAALATIIGQFFACFLAIRYLVHFKTVKLEGAHFVPRWQYVEKVIALGAAPCFNQVAMMIVQIVMNRSLTYYGKMSIYGEAVPLACAGIIAKVSQVFFSVIIGISQGQQPIASFNYGARKYGRVKKVFWLSLRWGLLMSIIAFAVFQLFPRQIIALFEKEPTEMYFVFAERYFRIFLFFTFINCVQPITSTFFTAIGKPKKGIFLSLTRQILFLLPLILILPRFMGIDGIVYSGPIADAVAAIVAGTMIIIELRKMKSQDEVLAHA